MQYTTHRRSIKDFWKSRNTIFYLSVFLIFAAFTAVIVITIRKNNDNGQVRETDNDNTAYTDDDSDYTQDVSTSIKSGTYEIIININNCMVYVTDSHENVIYSMPAAVSTEIAEVKDGILSTGDTRVSWRKTDTGRYYRYYTDFGNGFTFHTAGYSEIYNRNSLITTDYNMIGKIAEIDGIMLAAADAKWIYENCSSDSTISVINEDTGKQALEYFKIPDNITWDPTDISSNSPWCPTEIGSIQFPEVIEIEENHGSSELIRYLKAYDIYGKDISEYIRIQDSYDISVQGTYNIYVQIADIKGNVKKAEISVVVVPAETETQSGTETETPESLETKSDSVTSAELETESDSDSVSETTIEETEYEPEPEATAAAETTAQ